MGIRNLILEVREYLAALNCMDERILDAMSKVDRVHFMPRGEKDLAYINEAFPIGEGQTISQPSTVARMLSLLNIKQGDKILEIGTGSGWNAALLSFLSEPGEVTSLEIISELANRALQKIQELKIKNVIVRNEDFRMLNEKFDKIIFTAGIILEEENIIVNFALKNLKQKGILVCPFQSGPLLIIRKNDGKIQKEYTSENYEFVSLKI